MIRLTHFTPQLINFVLIIARRYGSTNGRTLPLFRLLILAQQWADEVERHTGNKKEFKRNLESWKKPDLQRLIQFLLFDDLSNHYCVHRYTFARLKGEIEENL